MEPLIIEITKANYLGDYKISLQFSDGKKTTIDFSSFLGEARNPMTTKYLDFQKFKNFRIEHGDLLWGDYEMCFPIWDLYQGKI